ncbi:MAG: gliding motility-associated ABC transporter substrate-binding protein GldG [Bacteroidales bacterium]|nr:gliding motility-associated ABC transporter substrate-binding protein GldG [Bacteroidales bacterium]
MKKRKINGILTIVIGLLFVAAVNLISSFFSARLDLTSEKRFTLSPATLELLEGLDDYVYFKVMLSGNDMPVSPVNFQRLKNETREMLDEFRSHSKYIEYVFIDPTESEDPEEVRAAMNELVDKGLQPTQAYSKKGTAAKIIFPGAIISYKDKEIPVQLLDSHLGVPTEEVLNNSIQTLEYNLSNAIRKLSTTRKPEIAVITGHDEMPRGYMISAEAALREYYNVSYVTIDGQVGSLASISRAGEDSAKMINKYKALIIPGPKSPFSEKDKFILDQYIMRGGKVLWLVEPVLVTMDSLQNSPSTIVYSNHTNLEDQLFNYGVRLEPQLIMDLQCLSIPMTVGNVGGRPQIDFFPWYYFPVLTPNRTHPIVKNLDAIKTEFISPITLVDAPEIKSTILLTSSPYSKLFSVPDEVSLKTLVEKPDESLFTKSDIPVAVMLEGCFHSLYDNRIPPDIRDNPLMNYMSLGEPTAMVVISDADIFKNQFRTGDGQPLKMGYDQYTQIQFGNPELLLNIMNYLCDDSQLISVRSRELKLRILDSTKITDKSKPVIQIINLVIPSVLIILGGVLYSLLRKRKYTK